MSSFLLNIKYTKRLGKKLPNKVQALLAYLTTVKFGIKKLETSFPYLHHQPFRRGSRVWRTDGQTDRTGFKNRAKQLD